jgi:hypothetical protein
MVLRPTTLHPQSPKLWKMTRYFKAPTPSIPLLYHNRMQIYETPSKAELLARQFEQAHYLTLNMGSHNHSTTVTRHVNTFFRNTPPPPSYPSTKLHKPLRSAAQDFITQTTCSPRRRRNHTHNATTPLTKSTTLSNPSF